MVIQTKGKYLKKVHIWFEQIENIEKINCKLKRCDEIIIHGNKIPIEGKFVYSEEQKSLITDLTHNEDELWSQMTKTVRNEVNRAEREHVECKVYYSKQILQENTILDEFAQVYHSMYKEKGMENEFLGINELKDYARQNRLLVSVAYIDGRPVVFHSYVYGNGNSRFLHSCSEFRIEDNGMRNAIGRANKLLHWKDMVMFKNIGIQTYDWGGVHSFEAPNGIDKFKSSFGGLPISYFNITVCRSLRLKMYKTLRH